LKEYDVKILKDRTVITEVTYKCVGMEVEMTMKKRTVKKQIGDTYDRY